MALLDVVQKNIGESIVVLYDDDGDDERLEGVLVGLDSSEKTDDYPVFAVVDTDEGIERIPVN